MVTNDAKLIIEQLEKIKSKYNKLDVRYDLINRAIACLMSFIQVDKILEEVWNDLKMKEVRK